MRIRLQFGSAGSSPVRLAEPRRQRPPPADRGVRVVRARVDDEVPPVVLRPVRIRGGPREGRTGARPSPEARAVTQGVHRRCDHAEVLDDQRQPPEFAFARRGTARRPGRAASGPSSPSAFPRAPPSRRRSRGSGRCARGRTARRPPHPLDPPAVAVAPHRRPVVERVAPQLADRAERVGRRARPRARAGRARDGRPGRRRPAPRRWGCPRSAARPAPPHTPAARSTRGRSAPGPRPRPAGEPLPAARSSTPPAPGTRPPRARVTRAPG